MKTLPTMQVEYVKTKTITQVAHSRNDRSKLPLIEVVTEWKFEKKDVRS